MKRLRLLFTMPWVASAPYSRLIVALGFGMLLLASLLIGAVTRVGNADARALIWIVAFAVWFLWAGYVPAVLQLARDARKLCLPGIVRAADNSLLLFVALGIVAPVFLCRVLGAPQPFATEMLLAAATSGLAYMLLPIYLGIALTAGVAVVLTAYGAGMSPVAWTALIAPLIAIDVWRWWVLRSAPIDHVEGWNAATVFYCYRVCSTRGSNWIPDFTQTFLQRQLAKPTQIDLHGIGPNRPIRSLRLALGGFGMPKPALARLRDVGLLAGYVAAFLIFFALLQTIPADQHSPSVNDIRLHWLSPLLLYFGISMCLFGVTAFAGRTLAIWRKPDAELALLALLPRLGDRGRSKRDILQALLLPGAIFLCVIAGVMGLGALGIHAKWWAYLAIAICCMGAFGLMAALTLEALGGRGVHMTIYVLSSIVLFLLMIWLMIASLPTDQYHGPHPERIGVPSPWVLLMWTVFLLAVLAFAWEGWRDLRKRPHPFLANAR